MNRQAFGYVMLFVSLAAGCTKPPRAERDTGRGDRGPALPANGDGAGFVAVPPAPGPDETPGPGPAPDAGLVVLADAAAPDAAPELTPEELFEIQYPLHGVVVANLAPVYHRPDTASTRLGYLRKGGVLRLGLKVERGRGCVGGNWYPMPERGFVCSNSLKVDVTAPAVPDSPVPPDRNAVLPYRYGQNIHQRTYALSRLPSAEELQLVNLRRDALIKEDEELAAASAAADAAAAAPLVEMDAGEPDGESPPPERNKPRVVAREGEFEHIEGDELPAGTEPATPEGSADGGTAPPPDAGASDASCRNRDAVYSLSGPAPGTPFCDEDSLAGLVSQWLEKQFFISIDRSTTAAGERFYRTISGKFVPSRFFGDVEPPTYAGLVINPDMPLPIGFVGRGKPTTYRLDGRRPVTAGHISRQNHRFLQELTRVGNQEYWLTRDGLYVRSHNFGVVQEMDPPVEVEADQKWILVDLSDQLLSAYEGRQPVFAALISSGKENFETPVGNYRIVSKHVSATMDGVTEADGAYSIEDVPWTMFFNSNFALHGAFWHNRFGMTKSHGCVNMSPVDAKWIFEWSAPHLPEGWHGALASSIQPGTPVVIRE